MVFTHEILDLLPDQTEVCFVIRRLFTPQECLILLSDTVKKSFRTSSGHYPTSYRTNDRFVTDNEPLARQLFVKVKPYLPEHLICESGNDQEEGHWYLEELNSRIRYCRYVSGQYFSRHLDGVHYRSANVQSKLTFMVYLNDAKDFVGGRTLFYPSKDSSAIWAEYTPQQGDLIVFDHNLWHAGETLQSGEKFVLRSDILYRRLEFVKPCRASACMPYLEGHLGYIWQLMFLNQSTLISGGRDKVIKIWDASGICVQRLSGHENSVLCLTRMADDLFVSGSRDQSIRVWQALNGQFQQIAAYYFHNALILSLCRINDHTFASSGGDQVICIATLSGQILCTLHGHTDWVWQIIKLGHHRLASCSEDKTLKIWDYENGQCLATYQEHSPVHCLVSPPSEEWLISGNYAGEITIRKKDTTTDLFSQERTFIAHQGIVRTLVVLTDTLLVSGGEDNKIRVWNLLSGICQAEYTHQNFVQSVVVNAASELVSASYDGKIQIWQM